MRINPWGTEAHEADRRIIARLGIPLIMLAKTEHPDRLDGLTDYRVVALCETARGAAWVQDIARHPAIAGLMWGAEDLIASLNGRSSRHPSGVYRDVARQVRSRVLIAAKAAGRFAVDAVHIDIADYAGLMEEAEDAAAVGFDATACIHPSQVEVVRRAYAPSAGEIGWAERVVRAAERSPGAFRFEGRMIDEPVLRQARRMLDLD